MIAVLGSDIEFINELLTSQKKENKVCELANDNADGQIIISGDKESVYSFQKVLKEKKIKTIPLNVSAPFHCSLMRPAAKIMEKKILDVNFSKPSIKIISNVTAELVENPEKIKELLIDQIFSTVRWRESMIYISKNGINDFVEIGPGKVLSGMIKRTIKNSNNISINSIADIKNLNDKLWE